MRIENVEVGSVILILLHLNIRNRTFKSIVGDDVFRDLVAQSTNVNRKFRTKQLTW